MERSEDIKDGGDEAEEDQKGKEEEELNFAQVARSAFRKNWQFQYVKNHACQDHATWYEVISVVFDLIWFDRVISVEGEIIHEH